MLRAELGLPSRSELEGVDAAMELPSHAPASPDEPRPLRPAETDLLISRRFQEQIAEVVDEEPLDAAVLVGRLVEAVGQAIGGLEREMRVLRMEVGRAPNSAWLSEPDQEP